MVVLAGITIYSFIVYPIIYILPAYIANGAPVIFGGGTPVDFGKKLFGKPIFGRHKTVRGLVAGLLAGFVITIIESVPMPQLLAVGIALTLGTQFGDLIGSFVKRRLSKKEGSEFAFFDQYLFLVFALAFAWPFGNLPGIYGIIFILALTGILHKLTNILAHKAKIKDVPW